MIATVVLMVSNSSREPGSFDENERSSTDPRKTRIANLSEAYSLTDRETEILHLIAEGRNNVQIAQDLFISDGTARAHLHHIYRKLDVHSRKELNALIEEKDVGRLS